MYTKRMMSSMHTCVFKTIIVSQDGANPSLINPIINYLISQRPNHTKLQHKFDQDGVIKALAKL